jgi:Ser/Thr protein kinase RdoA (MazF antagonist)
MVSNNLLEFAANEYGFDAGTFKVRQIIKWPDQEREIFTFDKDGKEYIIDFEPDYLPQRRQTRAEMDFIAYLAENNISVAAPLRTVDGELVVSARKIGENFNVAAFEFASGLQWNKDDPNIWNDKLFFNWGKLTGDMHRLSKDYKSENKYNVPDMTDRNYENWGSYFDRLKAYPKVYKATRELLGEIADLPKDRDSYGLIHCDMHQENFLIDGDRINLFDFNDNIYGWFALDIGIALFHALWWGRKDKNGNDFTDIIVENFVKGYLSANRLSDFWLSKIPMFTKHRQICCFIPWFFNPEETEEQHQKEWKYNIENDILFDKYDLKTISDIIEEVKS